MLITNMEHYYKMIIYLPVAMVIGSRVLAVVELSTENCERVVRKQNVTIDYSQCQFHNFSYGVPHWFCVQECQTTQEVGMFLVKLECVSLWETTINKAGLLMTP